MEEEVSDDVAEGARGWKILLHYKNVFILRSGTGEEIVRVIHPRCGPVLRFFFLIEEARLGYPGAKLIYKMLNAKKMIRIVIFCKNAKIRKEIRFLE